MPISSQYTRPIFDGMFDESKRYIAVRHQMKKPAVDADINEISTISYTLIRRLAQTLVGDKAVSNSYEVQQATSNVNNFKINGGAGTEDTSARIFVGGFLCKLLSDVDYLDNSQHIHAQISSIDGTDTVLTDDAANWTVNELAGRLLVPDIANPGTTTAILSNTATTITVGAGALSTTAADNYYRVNIAPPGVGTRTDIIYLDVYPDEISTTEDTNLLHSIGNPPVLTESALRTVLRAVVKVRQGSTTLPTNFTDAIGRIHYYTKLATLVRTTSTAITSGIITDERSIFSSFVNITAGDGLADTAGVFSVDPRDETVDVAPAGLRAARPLQQVFTSLTTTGDEDPISNTDVTYSLVAGCAPSLYISGSLVQVGDGVKNRAAYASDDGGVTALGWTDLNGGAGIKLYWMGSIAGWEITASDEVILHLITTDDV